MFILSGGADAPWAAGTIAPDGSQITIGRTKWKIIKR